METPVKQLRKGDIEWLASHRCKAHRHSYLTHYQCFLSEDPKDSPFRENVAIFDIETTGLKGDYHYVLSYALLTEKGQVRGRVLTRDEIRNGIFDRDLMKELNHDLRMFHRVVGHYMERFDLPFVRTRAVKYGYDFPLYKSIYVTDTWAILKYKFSLASNRLGTACDFFGIKAKTHPLTPAIWHAAGIGDEKALAYI